MAAALQEKKESEKARGGSEHGGEKGSENHDDSNSDVGEGSEDDFRRGLTSEERVLLREKKKERLMKENENEHHMDEGLNLSVCKPNGNGSEHPTKLEALLAKPIEDLPPRMESQSADMDGAAATKEKSLDAAARQQAQAQGTISPSIPA